MALKKLRERFAPAETKPLRNGNRDLSRSVSPEIEKEFNDKVAQGWFDADTFDKRDVLIREFDPNAENPVDSRGSRRPCKTY